ncbi:MarR family transcriptional regulator [Rhizobium sp. S152]|uniref:MarR family winged helix-turn-helix transcriptional regulator n=1 Tax=Rhizobium sp. S152 TaxID=3055038 RepID=UPI0025A9F689|nr:MarR family transcriptional regulator [Rhizobium sp. S152]MDM9627920.1 MarR family transcriptional regulator [Rhizobium sp. S152]
MSCEEMEALRKRLGIKLALLARAWRRAIDCALSDLGLTDATWAPLLHLNEYGEGVTQKELAFRVGIDASTLVRVLDILSERGLIKRTADADDRRARKIYLTTAGRKVLSDLQYARDAVDAKVLADVDDQDILGLVKVFKKIDNRLQEMQRSPRVGET